MKDTIISKRPMTVWVKGYDKKKFEEPYLVRADRIEYSHDKKKGFFDHHLLFYLKDELVFKVWLKNKPEDKEYKSINDAFKDVGINVVRS